MKPRSDTSQLSRNVAIARLKNYSDGDLFLELQRRGYQFGAAPGKKYEMMMMGEGKDMMLQRIARVLMYCPLDSPFNKDDKPK